MCHGRDETVRQWTHPPVVHPNVRGTPLSPSLNHGRGMQSRRIPARPAWGLRTYIANTRGASWKCHSLLFNATHRHTGQPSQFANLARGECTAALYEPSQLFPLQYTNVVRLGRTILPKPRLPRSQQKVGWAGLIDRGRERNYQDGSRPRVAIATVCRYDDNRPRSFIGRVGWEMCPPDLAAKRIPHRRWSQLWASAASMSANILGPAISAHFDCSARSASEAVS